jgi:hypothetical protein
VEFQTTAERTFNVTVIPFVKVSGVKAEVPAACLPSPNEAWLTFSILSSSNEDLLFAVSDGWSVQPGSVDINKGKQDIQLQLQSVDELSRKTQHVELVIEGRDSLEVQPNAVIGMDFQFPSIYTRCRTPIHLSIVILLVAVSGIVSFQRVRKAALPSKVCGTLRHWETGNDMTTAIEIDLTKIGKSALTIGSGATCDVMIPHAALDPEQARVVAEKSENGVDIYLEPTGEVRKVYRLENVRFVLQHGSIFRMGTHEFQYLSDYGE